MNKFMVVPQGKRSENFIELARQPETKGRLFRKHILSEGVLHYGGKQIALDTQFLDSLVKNFKNKACDIVQVPIVGNKNEHVEDPLRNIGEVVDLEVNEGKLYAVIDSRKEEASEALGKTLIGASAMISTNYIDNSTGEKVGPTLLHVAITNRPHVLNLEEFEEIIEASSESSDEVILLSEDSEEDSQENIKENQAMNYEELISELKEKHDVDVPALQLSNENLTSEVAELQGKIETAEELSVTLSNTIKEHLASSEVLALSNAGEETSEALIETVTEAGVKLSAQAEEIGKLSTRVDDLELSSARKAAEIQVEKLVETGRVLPVQRDAMIELRLSNEELFDKMVPDGAIIDLSGEEEGVPETPADDKDLAEKEVQRILGETK